MRAAKILNETFRAALAKPADASVRATRVDGRNLDLPARLAAICGIIWGRIVFTTTFGIEDQAIAHAIFSQGLAIDVVTVDTGRLFPETYELWARTEKHYGVRITAVYPDQDSVESVVTRHGINGFYGSIEARHACCAVRRAEPLRRALAGAVVWITGLRADQSHNRAAISIAVVAPRHRLIKVNPLFDWTREEVLAFIGAHRIPYNSLHDRGFAWIGCAPCTRSVAPEEPECAARWWWETAQDQCTSRRRPDATAYTPSPQMGEEAPR